MAITQETIQAAVEKYLPRTINYAYDSSGNKDASALHGRITQIVLTSLLLDESSVFGLVRLSAEKFRVGLKALIVLLSELEGASLLRAVRVDRPEAITDLTHLTRAQSRLRSLRKGLEAGEFSDAHFAEFSQSLSSFLSEQVQPKLLGRNRTILTAALKSQLGSIQDAWASVQEDREALFSVVDAFADIDLRALVSKNVEAAVSQRLTEIQVSLIISTASEQALMSESILLDSVAASAALGVVADAPDALGSVVVDPTGTARTSSTYLEREGTFQPIPPTFVLKGTGGRLFIDPTVVSTTGTVTDDVDDDTTSPYLTDADADLSGVAVGDFLTFTKLGRTHRITEIDGDVLSLFPEVRIGIADPRYVITEQPPGAYFRDSSGAAKDAEGNTVSSFWLEGTADTGTAIVATAALWDFLEENKASGDDGENTKATGVDASSYPIKYTGATGVVQEVLTDGEQGDTSAGTSTFFDVTATFETSGAEAGMVLEVLDGTSAGVYEINVVVSEDVLALTTNCPTTSSGCTWEVRRGDSTLVDANATFLSTGVVSGDALVIDTGPLADTYTVDEVVSETELTITTTFGATAETAVAYIITASDADVTLSAPGANFVAAGVEAGDTLTFSGSSGSGTREVASVVDSETITVTVAFSFSDVDVAWSVLEEDGVLRSDTAAFESENVSVGDVVSITGVGEFSILEVTDQNHIVVDGTFAGDVGFSGATWRVYAIDGDGDEISHDFHPHDLDFEDIDGAGTDLSSIALLDGVYRTLHFSAGGDDYDILYAVVSGGHAYVSPYGKTGAYNTGYSLIRSGGTTSLTDAEVDFTGLVAPGDILVLRPGTEDEERSAVAEVSGTTLTLTTEITADLTGVAYAVLTSVKPGMELHASGRTAVIKDVIDATTLWVSPPLSAAVGVDVSYVVAAPGADLSTRTLQDPDASFTEDYVGMTVEFLGAPNANGLIKRFVDSTTVEVTSKLRVGRRSIAYRIRSGIGGETHTLLFDVAEDPGAAEGDVATLWGIPGVFSTTSGTFDAGVETLHVGEALSSSLADVPVTVVSGGSVYHGRYLLLAYMNDQVTLEDDTDTLRARVAEVLTDYGGDSEEVTSGTDGLLVSDGSSSLKSTTFGDDSADLSSVLVGDLLTFMGTPVYVTEVLSTTRVSVVPGILLTTAGTWAITRTSVSYAINESARLRAQVQELVDLLDGYTTPVSSVLADAVKLMRSQGLDRAADALLAGDFESFVGMDAGAATYAGNAKAGMQSVGASLSGGADTASATYKYSDATEASSLIRGEHSAVVALARSVADMSSGERASVLQQITQDELKNRAIYQLVGTVESSVVADDDPTMPWVADTGSMKQRLLEESEAALAAVQYVLDHPEEFSE